ncbi:MAG: hypothetical protein AAFX07_00510 [Pseudomonadota bacterium]
MLFNPEAFEKGTRVYYEAKKANWQRPTESRVRIENAADRTFTVDGNPVNEASGGGGNPPTGDTIDTLSIAPLLADTSGFFAPFPAHVNSDQVSTDPRFTRNWNDQQGRWSCSQVRNFTALTNNPIWGTDASYAYGAATFFVLYENATVSFRGYDWQSNRDADNVINFTVNDQDATFAGGGTPTTTDTACVSLVGTTTGAPDNAAHFTDIASALAYLDGKQNQRLLLHAGEFFPDFIQIVETSGSNRLLMVGSYGDANDGCAILDRTALTFNSGTGEFDAVDENGIEVRGNSFKQIVFDLLDIRGPFDATTGFTGAEPTAVGISLAAGSQPPKDAVKLVNRCKINGMAIGVSFFVNSGQAPMENMYFNDMSCTNWITHALFGQVVENWGFAGCSFKQPPGSINADEGIANGNTYSKSSAIRVGEPMGETIMANNDIAVYSHNFSSDGNRLISNILRIHDGGQASIGAVSGSKILIDRMRSEGGAFELYTNRTGQVGRTDNEIVADRIVHTELFHAGAVVSEPHGGSTMRNFDISIANTSPGSDVGNRRMLNLVRTTAPITLPIEAYGGQFTDYRSDANARDRDSTELDRPYQRADDAADLATLPAGSGMWNIVDQTPNMTTGGAPDTGPVDETIRHASGWNEFTGEEGERYALDDGSGIENDVTRRYQGLVTGSILRVPLAGHSAINDADTSAGAKWPVLDMFGNPFAGHRGAYQGL